MQRRTSLLTLLGLATLAATPAQAQAQWSTETLSQARMNMAVATVGDLVLFAGGNNGGTVFDTVDIYDGATGTWLPSASLSVPRAGCAATVVDDLVLFGGGLLAPPAFSDVVDVFDSQSMTWSTATLSQPRALAAAATVGRRAFFAGGQQVFGSTSDRVDVYDASIGLPSNPAAWSTTNLSLPRAAATAVSVGDQVLFAGGFLAPGGVPVGDVDIYDALIGLPSNPAAWSTASLSEARILGTGAAAVVGTRAYFGGGHVSSFGGPDMSSVVDVYEAQTGAWSSATLSVARGYVAATAVGNTVLFAGGSEAGHVRSDVVDTFNVGTGQWGVASSLTQARTGASAATVGSRALFAGGNATGIVSAVVDVYEPVGVSYCAATPNSAGEAAGISASGSSSLAANDLVLQAATLPSGANFLFFHGSVQKQVPFRNGFLCTGGGLKRIGPPGSASGGLAQAVIDLPAAHITASGVRYFQCWYRDPAGGGALVNTSDAIAITFVP